jgi:hypothetical protein
MRQIHVHESFHGSVDDVFAVVSDHENFLRGFGIEGCRVTTPGDEDRNGLGAIREIDSGPIHFVEEVVRWDPPHRYDYQIRRMTLFGQPFPMEHERGWLELAESRGSVRVDWFSRFRLRVPLVGGVMARGASIRLASTFRQLLTQAKG